VHTELRQKKYDAPQKRIALRRIIIQSSIIILLTFLIYYFSLSWELLLYFVLSCGFILLIFIDHEHYLLPDMITLPLLWLGLLANTFGLFVSTEQSIWGAIAAYLSLYSVSRIFKYIRGIEGLGRGDCKLFAVFGAWWGIHTLLPILLVASLTGSLVGMSKIFLNRQNLVAHIPFGPYLILGAVLTNFTEQLTNFTP
jgi:leader peptidase (prepilin peptidase)/N-methyltransferase